MAVGGILNDMEFSDYGVGGPMLGAETLGFDLANALLGGPEQGGLYTGGMGGGSSRTEAERQQAILDVNPYVAPSQGVNPNPITSLRSGGQTGYYFANELGLPARYGDVGLPQAADPTTFDPNAKYAASAPGFVPVDQNASYRLVKGGKDGNVVYAGAGEEGLRNVFQQANKLTLDDPKNAYWGVEVLDPATGQYKRVAENQGPNGLGIVGDIAGVALPIAAAIATGGASLGVQIAAGAAAGGLGGFLSGQDPLKAAILAGATAGLGNVSGANEAISRAIGNVGGVLAGKTAEEVAKTAAEKAAEQIVVTGLSKAAQGAGSAIGNTLLSQAATSILPPQAPQPPVDTYADVKPIDVIASKATPNYGGALLDTLAPIATDFLPKSVLPQPLPSEPAPVEKPAPADETIVVTAPKAFTVPPLIPGIETAIPAITQGALTAAQTAGTPAPEKDGVLGTGLNIAQLLSIGSIGADLLKNLLAGGGGAEATAPYTSPFGAGVGFGTGQDMRVNPNIIDYERYGFGPEAMFFAPGYGRTGSAAAPAPVPQAAPIMSANPVYQPLI